MASRLDWPRDGSDDRGPPDRGGPHPGRRLAASRSRAAAAELDDSAREKLRRGARGRRDALRKDEPTYGVNDRLRSLRLDAIPGELAEELQLRLLRSHACGVGEPYPGRDRARGDAHAREHAREGLLRHARRGRRAPARLPRAAASCRRCRAAARSARAATSRRSRTSRSRSSAKGGAGSTASCSPGGDALARSGSSRSGSRRRRGSRSSTARSSWARSRRSASSARGGSRRRPTSRARCRSRRCRRSRDSFLPQIHELRPLRGPGGRRRANILALLDGSAIIEAHRWCDQVQDAYSLRCAAQVHGAVARPARLRRVHGRPSS